MPLVMVVTFYYGQVVKEIDHRQMSRVPGECFQRKREVTGITLTEGLTVITQNYDGRPTVVMKIFNASSLCFFWFFPLFCNKSLPLPLTQSTIAYMIVP